MLKEMVTFNEPKSPAAEAFRTLRTNLQFSTIDDSLKSLIITSSGPGEGKSTVITNLAITMAQNGKRVLILDCDLRKPTLYKKLGLPNNIGMTNILIQEKKLDECIIETKISNLYAITSGPVPPNPAELLNSKRMERLLRELEGIFDIILIDAPPVIAVTDAQILSRMCSGTMLLTCYGKTEKEAIIKAKDLIVKSGGNLIGVVLNKVPRTSSGYYGKYYGEYYE